MTRALSATDDAVVEQLLANVSPRVRPMIRDEIEMRRDCSAEEVVAARQRVMQTVHELAQAGRIGWPPESRSTPESETARLPEDVTELIRRPVTELSEDQLIHILRELTQFVRANGLNACEEMVAPAGEFLGEGVRLMIDTVESPLVRDLLETRMRALLRRHWTQYSMTIEAIASVFSGDNPRIVAYKHETFYRDKMAIAETVQLGAEVFEAATVERLRETLQRGPFLDLSFDEMRDFFVALSILTRRDGKEAISELADVADDPLLRQALRTDSKMPAVEQPAWVKGLEVTMREVIETRSHRYQMAVDGLIAIQSGELPEDVAEKMRRVQRRSLDEIFSASAL